MPTIINPYATFPGSQPFGGHATLANDLESWWPMNEGSGTSIADVIGSLTLTFAGTSAWYTDATYGSVPSLNGTNAYLYRNNCGTSVIAPSDGDLSIGGMVYINNTDKAGGLASIWDTAGERTYRFITTSSGANFYLGWSTDGTNEADYDIGPTTIADEWVHAVLVMKRTSNIMYGYINGSAAGFSTSMSAGAINRSASGDLHFGKIYSYLLKGYFCKWGAWSRALTSTEVTDWYNSGNPLDYQG